MPVAAAPRRAPSTTAPMPSSMPEPARQMERGRPPDLDVPGALGSDVLDELSSTACQRGGVLEQRDGQLEGPQQVGLVAAAWGRHEASSHGCQIGRHVRADDPRGVRQLERGLRTQRAIEMEMQLRLGHGQQPRPAGRPRTAHD